MDELSIEAHARITPEGYRAACQELSERIAQEGIDYKAAWARIERALEYGKPNPRMMTVHPWFRGQR